MSLGLYGSGLLLTLACLGFIMPQENALRHKLLLAAAFFGSLMALVGLCAALAGLLVPELGVSMLR